MFLYLLNAVVQYFNYKFRYLSCCVIVLNMNVLCAVCMLFYVPFKKFFFTDMEMSPAVPAEVTQILTAIAVRVLYHTNT